MRKHISNVVAVLLLYVHITFTGVLCGHAVLQSAAEGDRHRATDGTLTFMASLAEIRRRLPGLLHGE